MIDWFTVIAQIINFLVLVAILRYFLYGRILRAIDARQEKLETEWREADRARALAEEELAGARREHQRLAEQREQLLAQVKREVEEFRGEQLAAVREEIERRRQRWADTLAEEQVAFFREMKRELAAAVLAIARRVLQELADASLERMIVAHFLTQLSQIDEVTRDRLAAAIDGDAGTIRVRTSLPIAADLREQVELAVCTAFSAVTGFQWEVSPDLLCGIAIHTDDEKIAWDVRDELDAIERELQQTIDEEIESHRRAAGSSAWPKPETAR